MNWTNDRSDNDLYQIFSEHVRGEKRGYWVQIPAPKGYREGGMSCSWQDLEGPFGSARDAKRAAERHYKKTQNKDRP